MFFLHRVQFFEYSKRQFIIHFTFVRVHPNLSIVSLLSALTTPVQIKSGSQTQIGLWAKLDKLLAKFDIFCDTFENFGDTQMCRDTRFEKHCPRPLSHLYKTPANILLKHFFLLLPSRKQLQRKTFLSKHTFINQARMQLHVNILSFLTTQVLYEIGCYFSQFTCCFNSVIK